MEVVHVSDKPRKRLSKKRLYELGYGTCKEDGCRYGEFRKRVPYREWAAGDDVWLCPICGYGVAPMRAVDENIVDRFHREHFGTD